MNAMDDRYRLVFRGEVLDNQHPAVVKKRLTDALKLTDEQAEKLFAGTSVVVKQEADAKTAARYQGLFKQAGGRLRVVPVGDSAASALSAAGNGNPRGAPVASGAEASGKAGGQRDEIDISHLEVLPPHHAPVDFAPKQEILAPDYSLAKLGVNIVEPRPVETLELTVDFELAELGALIPSLTQQVVMTVNMDELAFEVAEVGADIGEPATESPAVAPDVSHLSLVD
jgi:hypothetical protein